MHDTTDHIRELQDAIVQRMAPSERLIAAAGMYETVRVMVLASLPRDVSLAERVEAFLERMYGDEIAAEARRAVAQRSCVEQAPDGV